MTKTNFPISKFIFGKYGLFTFYLFTSWNLLHVFSWESWKSLDEIIVPRNCLQENNFKSKSLWIGEKLKFNQAFLISKTKICGRKSWHEQDINLIINSYMEKKTNLTTFICLQLFKKTKNEYSSINSIFIKSQIACYFLLFVPNV